MYNLKNIKEEFKSKGIFYTQPELAEYMKSLVDIEYRDVYDPTCGDGSLLACFGDEVPKFGQEINDHQLAIAKTRLKNFTGVCGDTLANPAFMDRRFSCIVANPPFSIKWQPPVGLFKDRRFVDAPALPPKSKADYAFLLHVMHLLADDGVAVVLNFPGTLYRGNSEGVLRRWFVEKNYVEKVIQIPGKTFVDTAIATVVLVLTKRKISTDIEFVDNELKLSRVVPASEVAANDYMLSVSAYVQTVIEKKHIDPSELQKKARAGMLRKLKSDIEMDRMVCEIEGWDLRPFLDDLKNTIEHYYY